MLKPDSAVLTGFQYYIRPARVTPGLQKSIEAFVDAWGAIILVQEQLLASVASAAQFDFSLAQQGLLRWRVEVVDFNDLESKLTLVGYLPGPLGDVVKVVYTAFAKTVENVSGGYSVRLGTEAGSKFTMVHKYDVFVPWMTSTLNEQYWTSVVYGPNNVQAFYNSSSTFSQGHFEVVLSQTTLSLDQQQQLAGLDQEQEIALIDKVGQAIAAVLSKWLLNLELSSVELRTVVIQGSRGFVDIVDTSANATYKLQFSQVDYATNGQPLYYARVFYPSGVSAGFLFSVAQTLHQLFFVGVVNAGLYIEATYLVGTHQIDLTRFSRIVRLDLVATPQILLDQLDQYIDASGQEQVGFPNNTGSMGDVTAWELEGGFGVSNVTDVLSVPQVVTYEVFVNYQTGERFYVFLNNSVVKEIDGSVLSYGGGRQWIIEYLVSHSEIEGYPGYETYTLPNGTIYYLYSNGTTLDSSGNAVSLVDGLPGLISYLNPSSPVSANATLTYQIFEIPGMHPQFIVFDNGSVFTYPNQATLVCRGGIACLKDYVSAVLTQSQQADYTIATDAQTGSQYIVWGNGTVTFMNGTFICNGGSKCLIELLSSQSIKVNEIVPETPKFQIITLSDGSVYHLTSWGGQISFPNGTVIKITGGINGLLDYLN